MASKELRVRYSVRQLQDMYDSGTKKPLEDVWRAWKGIKELELEDLNSFFNLAGYHGEPFVGAGAFSNKYWGGYCNHGNVLFPTWHRIYVLMVERALQSIVPDVMLPYWDETSPESLSGGIPWALTREKVELDGAMIQNPLISYTFPVEVDDAANNLMGAMSYTKQTGYATVRYPLSGLVGTEKARTKTHIHNDKYPDYDQNVTYLNENVKAWLNTGATTPKALTAKPLVLPKAGSIHRKFLDCLSAPEYTSFSNTTSAAHWNKDPHHNVIVTALEDPHNDIHLSVGGFYIPNDPDNEFGEIAGANADMGENNTASFDPIFFFHHCNVDRMFWLWQKQHGCTDGFEIKEGDPGATSMTAQGPTPNFLADSLLSMDTPLTPFMVSPHKDQRMYTSHDAVNIETQLGLTYSEGSLEAAEVAQYNELRKSSTKSKKTLLVSGINRELFAGSFLMIAYADINGKKKKIGAHSVLSRWSVKQCANCLSHLEVEAAFSLEELSEEEIGMATFSIDFQHRGGGLAHLVKYKLEVVE